MIHKFIKVFFSLLLLLWKCFFNLRASLTSIYFLHQNIPVQQTVVIMIEATLHKELEKSTESKFHSGTFCFLIFFPSGKTIFLFSVCKELLTEKNSKKYDSISDER